MNCPKCNAEWDLDELMEYYYEKDDVDMLNTDLASIIEKPIDSEINESVCISCPEREHDFQINMKFKKIEQTIEEIKG